MVSMGSALKNWRGSNCDYFISTVLTDDSGLQIDEDGTGNVLASAGLAEEGVEGVVTTADGLVGGHLAIRLDAVLQAVQFPAGIADLDTSLADVDGDALTLKHATRENGYTLSWSICTQSGRNHTLKVVIKLDLGVILQEPTSSVGCNKVE
jgi:hypothetical protein